MNEKQLKPVSQELAYVLGVLILAIGTAITEKAGLGMSMVTAPPYIIHLKISQYLPFYSFGMSCYVFEAVLLVILQIVLRKIKPHFIFSFFTAVFFGFALDGCIWLVRGLPTGSLILSILYFILGCLLNAWAVALLFKTYLPPEAYELFVKEIAQLKGMEISKCKTVYDVCSCLLAVILSFAFFGMGKFNGVGVGTVVCALVNGSIIGFYTICLDRRYIFVRKLGKQ